jgi:hypothetical protein
MAKFDEALFKLEKKFNYSGNPPSNETEYNSMKDTMFFEGEEIPTWSEVKNTMDNLPNLEDLKASAKAKLMSGEALTEDEANTVVL